MPVSSGGGGSAPEDVWADGTRPNGADVGAIKTDTETILSRVPSAAALKNTAVLYESTYPSVSCASGGSNVYGAYVALTAGLGYDVEVYGVYILPADGVDIDFAVELAKGAAASEVPFATVTGASDFISAVGYRSGMVYTFPTPILVTNQRMAARYKHSSVSAATAKVALLWRKVS